jgi:hypothetical protein
MSMTACQLQRTSHEIFRAFDTNFLERYLSRQSNDQTKLIQRRVSETPTSCGTSSNSRKLERYLLNEAEYIRVFGLAK